MKQEILAFHIIKVVLLIIGLYVVLYDLTLFKITAAANILCTVPISLLQKNWTNPILAIALSYSIYHVNTVKQFQLWASIYAAWNMHFCLSVIKTSLGLTLSSNVLPLAILFASYPKYKDSLKDTIFIWTLSRLTCLLVFYFRYNIDVLQRKI